MLFNVLNNTAHQIGEVFNGHSHRGRSKTTFRKGGEGSPLEFPVTIFRGGPPDKNTMPGRGLIFLKLHRISKILNGSEIKKGGEECDSQMKPLNFFKRRPNLNHI